MNRKTHRGPQPTTLSAWSWFGALAVLLVLWPFDLPAQTAGKALKRQAIVYMSDGTQHEGIIQLTAGKDFTLTALETNEDSISDTIKAVTIKADNKKVRAFNLNVVKEMTFSPHREEYLQKFKMLNVSFQGPDGSNAKKVRFGRPYPVIKPKCAVVFNSGEVVTGILNTRAMYLTTIDPDTGFHIGTMKMVIRSKYTGEPGQSYDDLVRVERIRLLDEGDQFARSMPIDFRSFDLDSANPDSGVRALTQDTLTRVLVRKEADGELRAHSTLGENVYLAAEVNGMWVAGWPAEGTQRTELFTSVETEFLKVQDYYNEKKLLGIIPKKNGKEIVALVRLRRDIPDPEFALAWAKGVGGGFEMGPDGELLEFYRLSIWKFVRDPKSGKMTLVDRGTFSRTRIKLETETPEMGTSAALWPVVMKDGKLIVGGH
ncbi:hypothetical protein ACFL34_01600 [Candidatus Sumerlaeota bacterium]